MLMDILTNSYEEHHQAAVRYEHRQWQLLLLVLALTCFLVYCVVSLSVTRMAITSALGMSLLGLFGLIISSKLHKRTVFHTAIKRRIRGILEAQQSEKAPSEQPIDQLEREAAPAHFASLETTQTCLYVTIILAGLILTVVLVGLNSRPTIPLLRG